MNVYSPPRGTEPRRPGSGRRLFDALDLAAGVWIGLSLVLAAGFLLMGLSGWGKSEAGTTLAVIGGACVLVVGGLVAYRELVAALPRIVVTLCLLALAGATVPLLWSLAERAP